MMMDESSKQSAMSASHQDGVGGDFQYKNAVDFLRSQLHDINFAVDGSDDE